MVTPQARGRWPKSQRIRSRRQYQQVQAGSRRVVLPHFIILLRAQDACERQVARLGVTASRKLGGAVIRNRSKRLVREAFRATRDLWLPGMDVVVVVRKLAPGTGLGTVVAEWRTATQRVCTESARLLRDAAAEAPRGTGDALPLARESFA